MENSAPPANEPQRIRQFMLVVLTAIGLGTCTIITYPFLPALAWAVAFAVIAFPVHAHLAKRITHPDLAAGISTTFVVAVLIIPLVLISKQITQETALAVSKAEEFTQNGKAEAAVARLPHGTESRVWLEQHIDVAQEMRRMISDVMGNAAIIARGSTWFVVQCLVCVFVLYFAFRDWRHLLNATRDFSPISRTETDYLFTRVADSIHATVYATVVTSVIQGVTGGLLFWLLGLPAPVLWGVVMTLLGIIPLVGAGLIWVPAAVVLALESRWPAAIGVVIWGLLMAGPIGNWMYAKLAGGRMRLHPVPVLISFAGGLVIFGMSGMVLGPVFFAVTMGIIEIWKLRLNHASPELLGGVMHANGSSGQGGEGKVGIGQTLGTRPAGLTLGKAPANGGVR